MEQKSKIEKIVNLDIRSIIDLTTNILQKKNYEFLENIKDKVVVMQYNAPLKVEKELFLFLDTSLSGNNEMTAVISEIKLLVEGREEKKAWIISRNHISKNFKLGISSAFPELAIDFFDRDDLIGMIDLDSKDYWKHDDYGLLNYEKQYCEAIVKENDLRGLKIFTDKYAKLLDIFIDPKIIHFYEDKETKIPTKRNISIENILTDTKPLILSGEAGTGKSTFLRRLGEILVKRNEKAGKKNLPIFITVTELFENNYNLKEVIEKKLNGYFKISINDLNVDYNVLLLIDSIDELELEHQTKIASELDEYYSNLGFRYIIGSRSSERLTTIESFNKINSYSILRFSTQQIQQFVSKFFQNEKSRADRLLEALRENRIIEKLPVTPLSLSLISILYEENNLEIPATITDIYDNFNSLLLGKAVVSSRVEFFDISFKERILSIYALLILQRPEKAPFTKEEFFDYFENYYKSKTIPVKRGSIEDVLKYIIEHTGVLYLKNNTYVSFYHDSFMEYYASLEIFKHKRELSNEYVDNFFDMHWQNSAVFFAGQSKDMSTFLLSVNEKISKAQNLNNYFSSINGVGYLLQALYQTDNNIRKESVNIALDLNIEILNLFIKLSADDNNLFKDFKLPIIWMINLVYFFENFNSGTLKEPLKMSFEGLYNNYLESKDTKLGYQALLTALTLNSTRINEPEALERLIFKSPLLSDNILLLISEITLNNVVSGNIDEIKKEVKKEFKKVSKPMQYLLNTPANRLRFSDYDVLKNNRKIKILTEGKSDAVILEHAFITLSNGNSPYWQIKVCGNSSGGASEVTKSLQGAKSTIGEGEVIIGLYDHDDKGLGEFGRLNNGVFKTLEHQRIKKHNEAEIYAVILPIPGEMDEFLKKDQSFNCFAIEHYFGRDFLEQMDAIESNSSYAALGIFKVKKAKKNEIEKSVVGKTDPEFFKHFLLLFEIIDKISNKEIHYHF